MGEPKENKVLGCSIHASRLLSVDQPHDVESFHVDATCQRVELAEEQLLGELRSLDFSTEAEREVIARDDLALLHLKADNWESLIRRLREHSLTPEETGSDGNRRAYSCNYLERAGFQHGKGSGKATPTSAHPAHDDLPSI